MIFSKMLFADEINISAKKIIVDKKSQTTIFEDEVIIRNNKNNLIQSNYATYNKELKFYTLKGDVVVKDFKGNLIKTNEATYDEALNIFKSTGKTNLITKEGYFLESENVVFNDQSNVVSSDKETLVKDIMENLITLNNFKYEINENIFKSVGNIKVIDKMNNSYEFSQLYIDEKKKEIIGTDSKVYFNQKDFKMNPKNKPRIFSNAINIYQEESSFIKSTFTMCNYREGNKCPPWQLNASNMTHNKKKKTNYYDNAVIKIYDIPIFYFPKLAHPDPTVDRRSGILNPSYSDTKNLGSSINLPYFWAINKDKDLTINSRLFVSENPLLMGEYRHAFKNSNLIFDFGFTEGYKNASATKRAGDKSHFFSKFAKKFQSGNNESSLEVNLQNVSDDKYLKLYKIDTNLVNYETDTLENYISFDHYNDDKNFSLGLKTSAFETLKSGYNDKYEYIFPEVTLNKNLYSDRLGYGNLQTNLKVHNYDTNKTKKFLINNLDWSHDHTNSYFDGTILTSLKNVNYEVKNEKIFKPDTTNELFGALGYLASIDLYKEKNGIRHLLKPKALIKYSPNHMRKDSDDFNLYGKNIFSLNRLNTNENFESGSNLTLGFDYEQLKNNKQLNFAIGQVINEKKTNKNMPSSSSLDKRFSDIVGSFNYKNKDIFNFNYNYALDQNFKETNYNEVNTSYKFSNFQFNLDYLEEDKTSDSTEYVKTSFEYKKGDNGVFSFSNKRDLIRNASEYYDLSYEYINDCLRAGLVYRREFYNDSELESENSLMFKITLNSFGELNSPKFEN